MPHDGAPAPVKIGIISAGPTHVAEQLIQSAGLDVPVRDDLPGADLPNDVGLTWFLGLIHAAAIAVKPKRPFAYAIIGNAHDRASVRTAFQRLLALDVDILTWWTFAPLHLDGPPHGEDAFDDLLATAVKQNVAVVFPAATGVGDRVAGMFPVSGVIATAPFLDVCPTPRGWKDSPPLLAAWGDWDMMKRSWERLGRSTGLPARFPEAHGHSLAVWSIVAALASLATADPQRMPLDRLTGILGQISVPITVRPAALTPKLGFLETDIFDVLKLQVEHT